MQELKATLSIDLEETRKELDEIEKQADRIIEKIKFIKKENARGN